MSTTHPYTRRDRWMLAGGITVAVLIGIAAIGGCLVWMILGLERGETDLLGNPRNPAEYATPRVSKVVDGDTIEVHLKGKAHREGPPARHRHPGDEGPPQAGAVLRQGGQPSHRRTAPRGHGGPPRARRRGARPLRPLSSPTSTGSDDGLFVNLELVRDGYADLLTYPPNVAHTAELQAAVAEARHEQRGLWQACGGPGRPA